MSGQPVTSGDDHAPQPGGGHARPAMRLAVIAAGLGTPSSTGLLADRLQEAVLAQLREHGPAEVTRIELRAHAHAIAGALLAGFPAGELARDVQAVERADAIIAVTPAFQGSYSGLFKSFLDLIDARALRETPVLIAATGGTERHSLVIEHAMRPLFSYLGALTVPTGVYAATADFGGDGSAALAERVTRAARQLVRLTAGLPGDGPAGTAGRAEDSGQAGDAGSSGGAGLFGVAGSSGGAGLSDGAGSSGGAGSSDGAELPGAAGSPGSAGSSGGAGLSSGAGLTGGAGHAGSPGTAGNAGASGQDAPGGAAGPAASTTRRKLPDMSDGRPFTPFAELLAGRER